MKSIYYTETPLDTVRLGASLGRLLKGGDAVLLFGDLGAGKTHFVKGIAEGLGVQTLVKSPTFAYVNAYRIEKRIDREWTENGLGVGGELFHYDLYRMERGDDLTSLGYHETMADPRAVNVVEWADRLGDDVPRRAIRVEILAKGHTRSIAVDFAYSARCREKDVEAFYDHWQTPLHVRAHCRQVASVGQQVAEAMIRRGEIVDINLVYTSCLLHDMCRVCDFKTLDRGKFPEPITDEKWARWNALRAEYAGTHHADIAHGWLREKGFDDTAEAIRLHKSLNIVDDFAAYTPESFIVYYADKRVKHTEIVSLKERFRDGRERYGADNDAAAQARFREAEKRTLHLEKTLFGNLDIKPADIR